jgi:hypothetical protein
LEDNHEYRASDDQEDPKTGAGGLFGGKFEPWDDIRMLDHEPDDLWPKVLHPDIPWSRWRWRYSP